jgi:uncharacterized membrane protein YphA (DoxX/SURF4 family)
VLASRNDRALSLLRIAIGVLFIIFAEYKLSSAGFIHGGFRGWIERFIADGAYPFMLPLLRGFVLRHDLALGWFVALGELAIGLSLVLGLAVRPASAAGLLLMLSLLFSSNYPGPGKPLWHYFGASLDHSILALCFCAFLAGDACAAFSIEALRRRRRHFSSRV